MVKSFTYLRNQILYILLDIEVDYLIFKYT